MPALEPETLSPDDETPLPVLRGGPPSPFRRAAREFLNNCLLAMCLGAVLIAGVAEKCRAWIRPALMALALCALVVVVYRPLLPGVFLMDDHRVMADDNPLVDGEFTLGNIWFQTDFVLSNIAFWLQWRLWGEHPGGYHAVNMALHALSALLLWRVLVRMRIPGAWVAGLVYAVHPVAVTSVARIAELKNTLSLPFLLLSLWAFVRFEEKNSAEAAPAGPKSSRAGWWYGFSLFAFLLALFSKTSVIMLPPVLLLYIWWRRGKVTWPQVRMLIPFFQLSAVFGVLSACFQKYQALAGISLPPRSGAERLMVAGNSIWFYWSKDWLPFNLNAFYPRWAMNAASFAAYLPALLVVAVFVLAWRFRRTWGRHILFAWGSFVLLLFPVLGFFDGQYLTWFQVSDHLQYLPMIVPLVVAIAGLASCLGRVQFAVLALMVVTGMALLGRGRAEIFDNEETLMRDCLAKNPAAWGAQESLATSLARRHDLRGAVDNFSVALKCQPNDPHLNLNLARALILQGDAAAAEPHFLAALRGKPLDSEGHRQYAAALTGQGRDHEAAIQWRITVGLKTNLVTRLEYAGFLFKTGDFGRAVVQLRRVVRDQPDLPEPLNNLSWLLATSAEDTLRNGPEAVRYAEKACALTSYKKPGMIGTLAAAYAEAGRFPEAIKTCQETIDLANSQGNTGFAAANGQLLALYQSGQPYHAPPATN